MEPRCTACGKLLIPHIAYIEMALDTEFYCESCKTKNLVQAGLYKRDGDTMRRMEVPDRLILLHIQMAKLMQKAGIPTVSYNVTALADSFRVKLLEGLDQDQLDRIQQVLAAAKGGSASAVKQVEQDPTIKGLLDFFRPYLPKDSQSLVPLLTFLLGLVTAYCNYQKDVRAEERERNKQELPPQIVVQQTTINQTVYVAHLPESPNPAIEDAGVPSEIDGGAPLATDAGVPLKSDDSTGEAPDGGKKP